MDSVGFINTLYPQGTILITYNQISPAEYIGGTWDLLDSGYYLVSSGLDEQIGQTLQPGLPNIQATFEEYNYSDVARNTGAMRNSQILNPSCISGGSDGQCHEYSFDASRSNSIYGSSNTVQPKSVKVYFWKRIDNETIVYNPKLTIKTTISETSTDSEVASLKDTFGHINTSLEQVVVTLQQQINNLKKYTHRITLGNISSGDKICFDLVTSRSTPFTTLTQVGDELNNLGYTIENGGIPFSYGIELSSDYGFPLSTNIALVKNTSTSMVTYTVYKISQEYTNWYPAANVYQTFLKDTILN